MIVVLVRLFPSSLSNNACGLRSPSVAPLGRCPLTSPQLLHQTAPTSARPTMWNLRLSRARLHFISGLCMHILNERSHYCYLFPARGRRGFRRQPVTARRTPCTLTVQLRPAHRRQVARARGRGGQPAQMDAMRQRPRACPLQGAARRGQRKPRHAGAGGGIRWYMYTYGRRRRGASFRRCLGRQSRSRQTQLSSRRHCRSRSHTR